MIRLIFIITNFLSARAPTMATPAAAGRPTLHALSDSVETRLQRAVTENIQNQNKTTRDITNIIPEKIY